MRAGKIASMALVLIVTVVATAVRALTLLKFDEQTESRGMQLAMFAGGMLAASALILVPMGFMFDRAIGRLRKAIEGAAGDESHSPVRQMKWLHPLTRALTSAVDQFRRREQAMKSQLNDLEIRHRVSEAERRQIEAALNALRDGVIVTDAFNEIVIANEAAANILGFIRESSLHKPIDDVVIEERLRQLVRDTRSAADFNHPRHVELELGDAPRTNRDAKHKTQDSIAQVFDVALAAVPNHKQEVAGVVTILHDLTREREISQMKSDFVSKASHELRTPLSSIRAYVEMLVDGEAASEQHRQEFYRIMQQETDRLGRLIDNMLNISRIEAGIVQIEREHVDMKALINRAVHTLTPQAQEKGISLHTRLSAVDLCVEGDADMLYQVVLNLVSNAVKYTPGSETGLRSDDGGLSNSTQSAALNSQSSSGNRVTISADTDNLTRSVIVSVADTGLGIPPDALPKLFDKFFRIENYKRIAKGTGLGLSLCKHIVETVHHGQVGVESKLGMGSKFWFSVPMRYAGSGVKEKKTAVRV